MRTSSHLSRFSLIVIAAITAACGSTSVSQISGPGAVRCQATLSSAPTMSATGGGVQVAVRTERECLWTANSDAAWLQVTPAEGQGQASLTITGTANPDALIRTGSVRVNGQQLSISQEAAPCRFQWARDVLDAPASGGTLTARLQTLPSCAWTAQSSASWLHLTAASGRGTGDLALVVDPNTAQARSGQVTVAGIRLTVSQAARSASTPTPTPAPAPTPQPPPQQCSYTVSPASRTLNEDGGRRSVKVETGSTCGWSASSSVSWIEIVEGAAGTGPGDVEYRVERNRGRDERTGTVTIRGQSHTVTQRGER